MSRRPLLEVCVATVEDAVAAVASGADRLELNQALSLGGLTPSLGLMEEVRARVSVQIIAMIRPRPGGFHYSDAEFEVMLRDARLIVQAGADGLAFGILGPSGEIDSLRCLRLLERCVGKVSVFHRAFDLTPDPFAALEALVQLGFTRVMTSGQEATAYNGIPLIAELIRRASGRMEVLPAGGINRFNITDLLTRTGCEQVHASLRKSTRDPSLAARPQVRLESGQTGRDPSTDQTDPSAVAQLRALLRR